MSAVSYTTTEKGKDLKELASAFFQIHAVFYLCLSARAATDTYTVSVR
jgi:hypothetical protein